MYLRQDLNLALMRKAAKLLVGRHDFSSFSIKEKDKTYVRNLMKISFKQKEVLDFVGGSKVLKVKLISITFKANAFARGMVRGIVGTLVKVGQGKLSAKEFKKVFKAKDRCCGGTSAKAQGLCLIKVDY